MAKQLPLDEKATEVGRALSGTGSPTAAKLQLSPIANIETVLLKFITAKQLLDETASERRSPLGILRELPALKLQSAGLTVNSETKLVPKPRLAIAKQSPVGEKASDVGLMPTLKGLFATGVKLQAVGSSPMVNI